MAAAPAPPLGISLGDPAGIGPELLTALWRQRAALALPPFVLIGALPSWAGTDVPLKEISSPAAAADLFANALPWVSTSAPAAPVTPGVPDAGGARQALASLETAVALARSGALSALVTLPVAKQALQAIGFAFPGQTEFLAHRCAVPAERTVMLLHSEALATVPLTVHVPLADVPRLLTSERIVAQAQTVDHALKVDFGIEAPRLVLAGLNPHAGEQGTIGREEIDVMAPALAALRAAGIAIAGPTSADGLFHAAARAGYDVALCPTHDQALIPIKALAFDTAVNVTLGLPIVRTSPDHGTAFALAGKGEASPASLLAAIRLGDSIARRRAHVR